MGVNENIRRGELTIFWLRIGCVCAAVFLFVLGLFTDTINYTQDLEQLYLSGSKFFYMIIAFIVLIFCFLVSYVVSLVYFLFWIYYSEKNIRIFMHTKFHPILAVIVSFIPYVGRIIDYFVFLDISHSQELYLKNKEANFVNVPKRVLNMYLCICLLSLFLMLCVRPLHICFILSLLLVLYMIFIVKIIRGCSQLENVIAQIQEDELIRKKVDMVLREREIEKLAEGINK